MWRALILFFFAAPAFAVGNYFANGNCGITYVETPVQSYSTLQEAVAAFSTVFQAAGCPAVGDSVQIAGWQYGDSFADVSDPTWNNGAGYNWSFGTIDGSPIPGAGGTTFSFVGDTPTSPVPEPTPAFLAAAGLVTLFALGYIGGHQR